MSETTNRTLNVFIETGDAQKAYDKLIAKEKQLNDALKETADPKKIKQLNTELEKLQEPISRAAKKLSGELAPSFNEVKKTVNDLGNRLKRMSVEDADYSKTLKQWRQANDLLDEQKQKLGLVSQAQSKVGQESSKFGSIFERTLEYTGAYEIITKITAGLHDLFVGSIDEAMEAEESTARFKATLDNLGKTEVFDRLKDKADEMAAKFKYLDNDEIVGVFEKLIDYGKLTESQINDLTPVIINFAAKQRISVAEATDVITKSLEGNAKALKTYGISLTDASTPAERLKVIMTELKDKVDGAADAFGNTTAGKVAIAKQSYKDLKEEIGNNLLPTMNKLLEWVNGAIKGLPLVAEQIKNTVGDVFTFFTSGPGAVALAKAERMMERMKEIEGDVIQKNISEFEGKSVDEIHAEIDRINQLISAKQSYINILQNAKVADPTHFTKEDSKNLADYTQGVRLLKGTLDGLYKLQDSKGNQETLGGGDPNFDPVAEKEAERKRKEAQKKILEDQKKLLQELHKLNVEYGLTNEDDYTKETAQAIEKYNALKELAHGNAGELQKIQEALHNALFQIQLKYSQKELDAMQKMDEQKLKEREKFLSEALKKGQQLVASIGKELSDSADKANKNLLNADELAVLQSRGKAKLDAQKKQLDDEETQAKNAAIAKGETVDLIEEQYRQKRLQAEKDYYSQLADTVLNFTQQALSVLQQFDQNKTDQENRELDRDKKVNDKKKDNLKKALDNKKITQQDYDRQVADMDKKQEAKEKQVRLQQFRRDQRMAAANALINGAQAVTKTIAEYPFPVWIPFVAITAAITAAQISAISKQQPPEFARGGLLSGPGHNSRSKGMPVTNPETGQVQAFMEGGEGITNKRTMSDGNSYTVSGTPSQIISSLNGLHGGVQWNSGARLIPSWRQLPVQRMNFDLLNSSMRRVRMFAQGGVFTTDPGGSAAGGSSPIDLQVLQTLATVVDNLNTTLANGIQAPVLLRDIENAAARKQAIIDDATMKP